MIQYNIDSLSQELKFFSDTFILFQWYNSIWFGLNPGFSDQDAETSHRILQSAKHI